MHEYNFFLQVYSNIYYLMPMLVKE